jgi:hypothetical protein
MGWKCSTHDSGAGKAVPLDVINAYVGVEVQLHSFLTSVFDGCDFQPRALSAVPVVKGPSVSIKLKARWDLEKRNILPLPGIYNDGEGAGGRGICEAFETEILK